MQTKSQKEYMPNNQSHTESELELEVAIGLHL